MAGTTENRRMGRLPILVLLLSVTFIFALYLKDILVPFLKLEMSHDVDGASALLKDKGLLGFLAVTLVEALQMVVVFVPAEFIQISSGLSYPFPIALALCDLGVCLGASIIFVLVRVFHMRNEEFEKRRRRIDRLSSAVHDHTTVFLLYLLFFMPMVPFGAICYYGSGTNLRYRRYILTVATGVIPSIVVSNLMGAAGKAFLVQNLPFWLLLTIIIALAVLLFVLVALFIRKFIFKDTDGTPDSMVYHILLSVAGIWHGRRQKARIVDDLMSEVDVPYIVLCNHESFFDFHYIAKLDHPRNPAFVVNDYYCTRPVLKRLAKASGMIGKKLFTPDFASTMDMLRTIRKGYPLVIFPEGRLSTDGRTNPIIEGAAFYKKLNVDLVLARIDGAYLSNPKWRSRRMLSDITVTVRCVLKASEIRDMPDSDLDRLIADTISNNAFEAEPGRKYRCRGKAKGLEGILYRCADCGALYTTRGKGNSLVCSSCGAVHTFDETYRFKGRIGTIADYYDRIKDMEADTLDTFRLEADVRTTIFGANGGPTRRETGRCTLSPEGFSYHSGTMDFSVQMRDLPALAYSCSKEFELYHDGELMYFYPTENPTQVARWALLVDMMAQRRHK